MVCCLTLFLHLWVLPLILSSLTFNSQCCMQCFFHQTKYSIKLSTSLRCSTKIESLLDISNAKRTMKIFWPVDPLDPFIRCLGSLCGVSIHCFRKSFSFNSFNAFVNSLVVWSGSNTRWLAPFKLHVKKYEQMLLSSVPVTIHDWPDRRRPCYCVVNGLVYDLLHPKHFLITFFTIWTSLEIH